MPLGLAVNHGFAQTPVVNSEVATRRTRLETQIATAQRRAEQAQRAAAKAHKAYVRGTERTQQMAAYVAGTRERQQAALDAHPSATARAALQAYYQAVTAKIDDLRADAGEA